MNKINSINIVFACDNNYAQHLCVSMASILLNGKNDFYYKFFILDGGISEKNKNKIKSLNYIKNFSIKFYEMKDDNFSDFKLNRHHISIATYYRLMLFDLLDKDIKKIIYLDCDTIIKKDLSQLWEIDLEEYFALVIEDECGITQSERLGLPINYKYFNAGVLVFNVEKMKEFDFYNKCLTCYKNNKNIITLQDQDILNILLNNKCKFIPLNWNANSRIYLDDNLKLNISFCKKFYTKKEEDNAKYNPYILHYTGEAKPWDIYCKHPLKSEYFRYLRFTKFRLYKLIYIINKFIFYYENTKYYLKIKILFISVTIKKFKLL